MSVTDTVADLLTRIRNANSANHDHVNVMASNLNREILRILQEEGFIASFEPTKDSKHPMFTVNLKYGPRKEKVITGLKRVSKPGRRVYASRDNVPRVLRGLGIAIMSTSSGLMTDASARKLGIGGEVICYVW